MLAVSPGAEVSRLLGGGWRGSEKAAEAPASCVGLALPALDSVSASLPAPRASSGLEPSGSVLSWEVSSLGMYL